MSILDRYSRKKQPAFRPVNSIDKKSRIPKMPAMPSLNWPKLSIDFHPPEFREINPKRGIYYIAEDRMRRMPYDVLFNYKVSPKKWAQIDAVSFDKEVRKCAKGLIAKGLKKGDSVAIIGATSFNWILVDYACALLGIVSVPIYETSSAKQIAHIFDDANVKLAFADGREIYAKAEGDGKIEILVFDENAIGSLMNAGKGVKDSALNAAAAKVSSADLLTIVYTSGSTGAAKGVEISHAAMASIAQNSLNMLPEFLLKPNGVFLLFLPLAHIFARFAVLAVMGGTTTIGVSGSIASLLEDLRFLRPTYTIAVPRIFEKVINASSQKAGSGVKGRIFNQALKVAIEYSQALDLPDGVPPKLFAQHAAFDRLVYKQIREVFGGRMDGCVCGGAPLSANTSHFFRGAGIPIVEGYGLTETTAPTFVSPVHCNAIGSIGFPFPGVEYKIANNGELIVKCASLFTGYHNDPAATKEVLKNGWLYTGDLARQNSNGSISIVGRSKDLIVTAGGKNISPGLIEGELKDNLLISNAVLVGDRRPFISAMITLDPEIFATWKVNNGLEHLSIEDAVNNEALIAQIQRYIDKANLLVSRAESIRKFIILPEEFSEENGLLTASLKIKRHAIYERYKWLIDNKIYQRD